VGNIMIKQLSNLNFSQEGIMNFFMYSPIGIYIIKDRRFSFCNPKFQEITGYSENELLKMNPMDLILAQDRDYVRENAIQMLRQKNLNPYKYRVIDKSGNIKWIIETVASVEYQEQRAVMGNFMDITETKKIESALHESEKKYSSLFEIVREGIAIVNYSDGTILDANPEFLNQTGYTDEILKGKKFWDIQPPEFQAEAKESFFRFKETPGGIVSWKLCQGKQGKIMPVEISTQHMIMDGNDTILCMVRDISEREAMMRALKQASEEWRKSFDAIDDALMVINQDFIIHRANNAAARMLKMDVKDLVGKKCHQLFHGTEIPPGFCPHLKAQTRGIYSDAEVKEPHLDKILNFCASPMKDNETGEITLFVEIISDVTSQKKYEKESENLSIALAKSFQGITESMSELAETRDPYTAGHSRHVADLAAMIGREMSLSLEDIQGIRTCAILHDIGKSIIPAAILNKPGKLSKHEWGLINTHPTTAYEALLHIPFPWPVADVVHQHHERLDGSGYPLGLKGNQIHPWARIIAVADVVDAVTSHRPYRPGMPRQNAIDELVNGRGTIYDPPAVDTLLKILSFGDKRILVVDEDSKILEALVEELQSDGLEAVGYTEPASALNAFSKEPFPLVITELNMIAMDGAELTQHVKTISHLTEIIVITKYGSKEDTLKALRAGATDFLEKPIDLGIFIKSVNRALQRYTGRSYNYKT